MDTEGPTDVTAEHQSSDIFAGGKQFKQGSGMDIGASMDGFVSEAKAGKIAVDPNGGAALLAFAEDIQRWYTEHGPALRQAASPPPLGISYAGRAVSPYMEKAATDEMGYVTQTEKLAERLDDFKAAINQAMKNYQGGESDNVDLIKKSVS